MNAPSMAAILLVLSGATFGDLFGQEEPLVAPGDKVRVSAPAVVEKRMVCTVESLKPDTLALTVEGRDELLALPIAHVTKLEVGRGQKSNAGKGALIGLGVGVVVGVTLGFAACAGETGSPCTNDVGEGSPAGFAAVLGATGAVLGTGIGALIGLAARTDRWETVPLDQIRVSLVSDRRGRLTVSASLFF